MSFRSLTPMLRVMDLEAALEHYQDVFNFVVDRADMDAGWAHIHRDDVALMLAVPNIHFLFDREFFTGSFYIYTDDVDECWEKLRNRLEVVYPIENFDYGMREFAVLDRHGYMFQFGQDWKNQETS